MAETEKMLEILEITPMTTAEAKHHIFTLNRLKTFF